ncbi:MAG: aspartyl-tRNA(Asn)/glutamyl-tRNA(Gln) amidotransferase subunit C [Candidatus Azotimanducaceae bacterium]|jgi:aspartyl-tRNA(Asn)/glutamyl-tRNA(Gln) amidotransferase subunit C
MELSIAQNPEPDSILRPCSTNFEDMKVDAELVKNVAALAQLKISEADLANTITSLTDVLDLVDEMQTVDAEGLEPMSNPLDAKQTMRADEVTESNQRERFQKTAPSVERGFFLVPRVIE